MASKKSAEGKGGKRLAVPAVALLLGVFAGPRLLGGGSSGEAGAAATTTTTAPGPVVALDPITLNLTDGHLLKVGLALQLSASWLAEHGEDEEGHGGAEADDPTRGYARALDAAIGVFSDRSMQELSGSAGRESAREQLASELHDAYHGEIEAVYLYEFVMQ